jgi:hypothetical protein
VNNEKRSLKYVSNGDVSKLVMLLSNIFSFCFQNLAKSGQELILEHAFARDCLGTLFSMYVLHQCTLYMYAYRICAVLPTLLVVFFGVIPSKNARKIRRNEMYTRWLFEDGFRVLGGFLLVLLVSRRRIGTRKKMTKNNF